MNYHLVGIKGISMSGLAQILKAQGHKVTGCDLSEKGHSSSHISKELDGLIISAAITPSSPGFVEVERAKELGIPVIKRSEMIGQMMKDKIGIAVAGTHGKTTVSAMISLILEKAGQKPSYLVGAPFFSKLGKGRYFVAEACEWERQFLDFRPKIGVITNIEEEHLDSFPKGIIEIKKAFKKFVKLLPKNGLLVLWQEDPSTPWLSKCARCKVKYFSLKKPWPGLSLKIPGQHNLLNATAAARVCHELGVSHKIIKEALNNFTGAKRRFEIKGEKEGIIVIDDYAHHPTEIRATLKAAREFYPKKRIICLFQPHQYLRTKFLLSDFARSFSDCHKLIMTKIYAVPGRDEEKETITKDLISQIKKLKKEVIYLENYDKILEYLKKEVKKGDLVMTMGATDIYQVGERLLKELRIKNGKGYRN